MECPACRAALPEGASYCPYCGGHPSADAEAVSRWGIEDLFEIARTLSSTLDLDSLLRKIGQAAERLTSSEASSILLIDDDRKNLFFKVATGAKSQILRKQTIPIGTGLAGWVAKTGEAVVVNDVSRDERFMKQLDNSTGFVTRSVLAVPLKIGEEIIGVLEVINKKGKALFGTASKATLENLANFAAVSINNARLADSQKNFFSNIIDILAATTEGHDPRYLGHPARTAELACRIARILGLEGDAYRDLYYAALLHDIGMTVLRHGPLLERVGFVGKDGGPERLHPVLGAELLKGVRLFSGALPIIRHHHESWDGSGFPSRLAGENIPLGARILSLADELDELRMDGLQEPELSAKQIEKVKAGSGLLFDPAVVAAYLESIPNPKESLLKS